MKDIPTSSGLTEHSACGRELAAKLAALSHPARLRILRYLAAADACCCKDVVDCLDLAQSTVSQHLKILVEAGLVDFTPERQRSRYTVNRDRLSALSHSLQVFFSSCCMAGLDLPMSSGKNDRA
ncbi:MAG: ArsR family transcriptional regulator [Rhizobiaceae bacterium]|nr:MAG: ArsR family transcriptional regulator [Rhizobiaceae bacterium]